MVQDDSRLLDHAETLAKRTSLSKREAEVKLRRLIAQRHKTDSDIAEEIGITRSTFSEHLSTAKEKLDTATATQNYHQFNIPIPAGNNQSAVLLYDTRFTVPDGQGELVLYENIFHDSRPQLTPFVVVHEHPETARTATRGVKRRRTVTDWYEFESPEQVAQGVLENITFDNSGMAGNIGRGVFIDLFEDYFRFDPTTVTNAFTFESRKTRSWDEKHRTLFKPTDTDTDVERTLQENYDAFASFFETSDPATCEFSNPITEDEAVLVITDYKQDEIAVLMADDDVYIISNDHCSCGHDNTFSSQRGEPGQASYNRRRNEACPHKTAELNAFNVGANLDLPHQPRTTDTPHSPCCPVCGFTVVSEHKKYNRGEWVMSSYHCALCDEKLATS